MPPAVHPPHNPIPQNVAYRDDLHRAAAAHRIDPLLLAAVAAQETGGPLADSGRNIVGDGGHGHGVFQIDDRDAEHRAWMRTHHGGLDVAESADKAAEMLRNRILRYGSVRDALQAYNAGTPGAPSARTAWPDANLDYAASVLRHYARLAGHAP